MEGKQGADLNLKKEFTERHLENRKREIQKILFSKRIHPKEERQSMGDQAQYSLQKLILSILP